MVPGLAAIRVGYPRILKQNFERLSELMSQRNVREMTVRLPAAGSVTIDDTINV